MDEYKVLTDIVNDSSISTAIISALLFLIYQFINKLFEYLKKKNDKNTTNTIKDILLNMKDISLSVSKLTDTVNTHLSSNIKKDNDKCRNTIILSFDSLEKNIFYNVRSIIINNNINKNENIIKSNLKDTINTEYYKLLNNLSIYEVNGHIVSTHLKDKWIDELYIELVKIIFSVNSPVDRITMIKNRLEIIIKNYNTYMTSKTFNE